MVSDKSSNKAKAQRGEKFDVEAFHEEWSRRDTSDIDGASRQIDMSGNE
jgi:hypothetical protein